MNKVELPQFPDIGEGMYPNLHKKGWVYRDVPWMSKEYWLIILQTIGVDNYLCIISSMRPFEDTTMHRGQFMISPEGLENLKNYSLEEVFEVEND